MITGVGKKAQFSTWFTNGKHEVRVSAAGHDIPLADIMTEVNLDRQTPGEAVFLYALQLKGPLTEDQRRELIQAAQSCPVHQTLAGKISFTCLPA